MWRPYAGFLKILVCGAFLLGTGVFSQTLRAQQPSAPNAAAPKFDLNELRVLGNSALEVEVVERVLTPFLGPDKTLQDVEEARAALETTYHDKGYGTVFVDIPEQSIADDGVVRLHVTESRLRKSSISGARYFSNRQIRLALPAAAAGAVPNLPDLQTQIGAVNSTTADRSVVPILKAGPAPGTVDLELKVQDKLPLHATFEVNDQYTADTSHLRAALAVSYDNAFGRQDSATVQYQASPTNLNEVSVVAASYVARLSDAAGPVDKLAVSYINSSSNVATVGDVTVAGRGRNYAARYLHPLIVDPTLQAAVSFGAEYKDSAQAVEVSKTASLDTPLSYASLQGGYTLTLQQPQRLWNLDTSVTIGLPGLGSSRQDFADKCYRCSPTFSVLRATAGVRQKAPWGLELGLQLSGQYAVDPLISNEQLLLGGAHTVRGYLEAEELGDIGMRGTLEIRATQLHLPVDWLHVVPFAFFDAGVTRFQAPLPGQAASASLRSVGIGFDATAWNVLTIGLNLAVPLEDGVRTHSGDERLGFLIRSSW